jgi:hypothetical protein
MLNSPGVVGPAFRCTVSSGAQAELLYNNKTEPLLLQDQTEKSRVDDRPFEVKGNRAFLHGRGEGGILVYMYLPATAISSAQTLRIRDLV